MSTGRRYSSGTEHLANMHTSPTFRDLINFQMSSSIGFCPFCTIITHTHTPTHTHTMTHIHIPPYTGTHTHAQRPEISVLPPSSDGVFSNISASLRYPLSVFNKKTPIKKKPFFQVHTQISFKLKHAFLSS